MEKSLNQPTLPHAVIALNATDMEINEEEWDPEFATKALLSSVAEAAHRDPSYQRLLDVWARRGKVIHTMKDLLECYYSSVTVVRIPVKGRYMKIDDQVRKLRNLLQKRCVESSRTKLKSRMLSNSEELNMYLQCAFDHFSQDLDTPFNFMDVAFRINPIPSDFGGNILKLAVAIKDSKYSDPRNIFRELSFMVASCILLDCSRHNLKGKHILQYSRMQSSCGTDTLLQALRSRYSRKRTCITATQRSKTSWEFSGPAHLPVSADAASTSKSDTSKVIRMRVVRSLAPGRTSRISHGSHSAANGRTFSKII